MAYLVAVLLWFSILAVGIMAGVYFTFSVFAMRSFAELGDKAGARAMQAINRIIQQSLFLPLFFASTLSCAALVVLALLGLAGPHSLAIIAGGAIYIVGMFVVTVVGNVPLNNRLDAADPASEAGQAVWRDYLTSWTRLNHIRTFACIGAMALLVRALAG